ncbi:growth-regulating factor 4-like [Salvia splendens]|uniref:growth-regulating factor 4-like n=1 Tax=Salvia splendens TaxID=180675 RepID=UPI001C275C96|nr:growth-regulating factor 4-like [Salvia splendens]
MSEKAVTTAELGYGGYRAPPFTQVQLKELEQQAIVYKYLVAGLPMPPDLVRLFRHSSDGLPACVFNQPALNYCSYYGKKFDPEPGRCRRTDGKKWRCSKDAHPDSKYCERHMHRGRNRSRKHVESQPTSQSLLTAVPHSSNGGGIDRGSSQQVPLYSGANPKGLFVGSNASKLYMGPYGISGREFSFSHEASGRAGGVDLGPSAGCGTWTLTPSHVSSSSLFKQGSDSRYLATSSAQQYMTHAFEPMNASLPKQQQHGLFGSDFSSATTLKQEHLFFSEWPTTKESWSNLDNDGSSQSTFTSTQLSMSIPRASSDFALGTAYSTNDG